MRLFHKVSPELRSAWNEAADPILLHYTGSMFGMGCNAVNDKAISKINNYKQRSQDSGYIVLLADHLKLSAYIPEIKPQFAGLIKQYSPGALTVVLPCAHPDLQHLLVKQKIAFRIPEDQLLREFLSTIDIPLISTSINKAGEKPQINYIEILNQYRSWFDLALVPENELIAEGEPSTVITLEENKLICLREGKIAFRDLEEDYYHPLITFVCTGNICRSPLAEYYFRKQSESLGLNWRSASAGFLDKGNAISENSRIILEKNGIESSAHRSEKLNRSIVDRSRLVLTMTRNHKQSLINAGWKSDHIYTLAEYVGKTGDIEDPYQEPLETYESTFQQIKYYIDILINKIQREWK